jgi:uncharacterized membrane protein HdeD (DUF308 family)
MTSNHSDDGRRHDAPPGATPGDPGHAGAKPARLGGTGWASGGAATAGADAAMSAHLARNWWAIALRGVFALLFGVIAVARPDATIGALTLLFAAYMLADGVFAIVAAVRAAGHHERWGALVLEGIVDLVAGAIAFIWPLATVLAFVFLTAAWAIVSGIVLIAAAIRLHPAHGRWLMVLGGIVSLAWGVLLVVAPIPGAIVMTWWIGGYALFFGGALLALAFRLRARRDHPA